MDLKAYSQIDELKSILKNNGIDIPRLRGIDLCVNMTPWTKEEVEKTLKDIEIDCCKDLCCSEPFWNPNSWCSTFSSYTDYLCDFYMTTGKKEDDGYTYDDYVSIRWNRIHGCKRKVLKTYIHNEKKAFLKYVEKYNSYCGKENIVRVHSRMGGKNWTWNNQDWLKRRTEIINSPWFIERVNDWYDGTYCDFYCKIN